MGRVHTHDGRRPRARSAGASEADRVGLCRAHDGIIDLDRSWLPSREYAPMAQNIVLTLINIFGIYRWLIWKGKI